MEGGSHWFKGCVVLSSQVLGTFNYCLSLFLPSLLLESVEVPSSGGVSREWVLVSVGSKKQLGSPERLREKLRKIGQHSTPTKMQRATANIEGDRRVGDTSPESRILQERITVLERRVQESERRLEEAERGRQEAESRSRAQGAVRGMQETEQEAEQRAWGAERGMQEAERLRVEANRRVQASEVRVRELEAETERLRQEEGRRAQEVEGRLREAEGRAQEAEGRVQEAEGRLREAEGRAREAEGRVQEAEGRLREAEGRAREAEGRVQVAEGRLREAEGRAREAEARQGEEQSFWVLRREEIQMTEEELGRGGWAVVKVATFRGTRVAAKCLHHLIISRHNRDLFIREMTMAARVRHPNLLQFIGATLLGELIVLTELMPTSLRAVLGEADLLQQQIISISLDVGRALNYLHLMKPNAIIHRDISSANVLLDPAPNNTWRAKVSDYGSVNLLWKLQTAAPGNPTYAPPEAEFPSQQSPKMDIFSFGVLLIETCTARFPDVGIRERLLQSIQDRGMVDLIRQCTTEDIDTRPTASYVIRQLNKM